jgi:NAD(P)-dependent dehydrogenase (short-subunit alcohol dehydrogenase family)
VIVSDLMNKVCLVTGAGGGMGRQIAQALGKQGMKVAICDVNEAQLSVTSGLIRDTGADYLQVCMDITSEEDVAALYKQIEERFGRLDVLVNCAAIWHAGEITEISVQHWHRMIDINLMGAFLMCRDAFPLMRKTGSGSIINFASTAGEYGSIRPAAHYAASKGGVIAMSKSLAREGAADKIRVNIISPGPTDTPMLDARSEEQKVKFGERTLLGRIGTGEDMANAVLFLASEASAWITGDVMRVNGGSLI